MRGRKDYELTDEIHCWTEIGIGKSNHYRSASVIQVWQPQTTNSPALVLFNTIDDKVVATLSIRYADVGKLRQALEGIHQ
jgi:hypothetical protein